jgi:hypothetical protein
MRAIQAITLAIWLVSGCIASGQTSSVQGQIVDPSGGVVPKAVVTLLKDTQVVKAAETDGQGRYRITLAPWTGCREHAAGQGV